MNHLTNLPDIPTSWVYAKLDEIGELNRGKSKHRPRNDPKLYGGNYPFIQTGDIRSSTGIASQYTQTYSELGLQQSKLWPKGTLCITIAANIAETAILGFDACFPDSVVGFLPKKSACDVKFIEYFLRTAKNDISRLAPATAQKNINLAILKTVTVPFPPINEQRRIVAKIEELRAHTLRSQQALDEIPALIDQFRQSVLAAAFRGDLTADWRKKNPDVEPAEKLLERIREEQSNKKGSFYKKLRAPEFEDNLELPTGWCWSTFAQVSERVTVGHVGSMKNEYREHGVPFLRSQNVRENRFDANGLTFISQEFNEKLKKSQLSPGDIVVVRSGSVGVSCVIPNSLPNSNCSDLVIVKRPKGINPHFGAYYMNSVARSHVDNNRVGIALTHFNTKSMAEMPIPVPPLSEQEKIVQQINTLFSTIKTIEEKYKDSYSDIDQLNQSILAKAFRGELVPQDPNDEPASVLLDRIRAEQEKLGTTKTQKRSSRKRTQ